jgi:hypothetical protein
MLINHNDVWGIAESTPLTTRARTEKSDQVGRRDECAMPDGWLKNSRLRPHCQTATDRSRNAISDLIRAETRLFPFKLP